MKNKHISGISIGSVTVTECIHACTNVCNHRRRLFLGFGGQENC